MAQREKTKEEVLKFIGMAANHHRWKLNPDAEFTESLAEGLMKNFNRYGYFLCPCRDTEGSRDKDADVICPCTYSHADVAEFGHCYCGLYLSESFSASGKKPRSIPERREQE